MSVPALPSARRAALACLASLPLLAAPASLSPASAASTARPIGAACPAGQVPEDLMRDVDPGTTHETAVDCVVWWGVAQGRASTSYQPAGGVTRAQMATFLANLVLRSGGTLPDDVEDAFTDDDASVHEPRIDRLAAAGIVEGRADGRFDPEGLVSRAELATFLVRAHEHRTGAELATDGDRFTDDEASFHEPAIDAAAAAGFTSGTGGGRYSPDVTVARAPMASFLARVLALLVTDGEAAPPEPAPGDLDAAFGSQGLTRLSLSPRTSSADVVQDRSGRLLATVNDGAAGHGRLVRLTGDGALDPSYGTDGVTTDRITLRPGEQGVSFGGVHEQSDGGAVVSGSVLREPAADSEVSTSEGVLVRFTADGRLDREYGDDGRLTLPAPADGTVAGVRVLPDGRLLASIARTGDGQQGQDSDVVLQRHLADGSLDRSFGDGGRVTSDVRGGSTDVLGGVLVQPNGMLLVSGEAITSASGSEPRRDTWFVQRYLPDGTLDPGFGDAGTALADVSPFASLRTLTLQPDGSIVAGGQALAQAPGTGDDLALARWTPTGELDAGFGEGGVVRTRVTPHGSAHDIVVQPDGRLLVTGRVAPLRSDPSGPTSWDWAVLRYEADGRLDPTFGDAGLARVPIGRDATASVLQPDGRLVVVGCTCPTLDNGRAGDREPSSFAIARFHAADPAARP